MHDPDIKDNVELMHPVVFVAVAGHCIEMSVPASAFTCQQSEWLLACCQTSRTHGGWWLYLQPWCFH